MTELLKELEAVVGLCDKAGAMMPGEDGNAAIAEAETAATNWVITHHAEIAEALKDARRYRDMRISLYRDNIIVGEAELVLHVYGSCPSIEQFDAAIDAHNSAREVGE